MSTEPYRRPTRDDILALLGLPPDAPEAAPDEPEFVFVVEPEPLAYPASDPPMTEVPGRAPLCLECGYLRDALGHFWAHRGSR